MTTTEVAIVGRGAVAMTAALAMARKGRMVTLFSDAEAAPGWRRHFALGRRSVDFLRGLGVTPPMRAVFCFALYGGGRSLVLREKRPLCHVVAEADLWRALAERWAVRLCRAVTWEGCEGREAVFSVDGERWAAGLLVAADGAGSPLAAQCGVFGRTTEFGQWATVAMVGLPGLAEDTAGQWFDDDDVMALLPMGDGRFSLIWSARRAEADVDRIAEAVRGRTGLRVEGVEAESVGAFPLRAFRRATRVMPRVAFVGDAARVIHPLAGQGLNLGLADVQRLARCLAGAAGCRLSVGVGGLCAGGGVPARGVALFDGGVGAFGTGGGGGVGARAVAFGGAGGDACCECLAIDWGGCLPIIAGCDG